MHGIGTPGPEIPSSSPPEPPRPPEPPEFLWGIAESGSPSDWAGVQPHVIYAYKTEDLARQNAWRKERNSTIRGKPCGTLTPLLLGVSPAVVAQRDKLGEALAEAETAARNEMEWLQTISATASPRYRLVEGRQRRWAALLAEWRAAQEREHKGSTADER
jgi:hypothetical protein